MDDESRILVEEASQGDGAAVESLLQRHLPGLNAFVRLRMGRELRAKESSSDLVQSACREVLQHMDRYQYRSEKNFKQWLYMTALRKVKNRVEFYRRDKRDVRREVDKPRSSTPDEERTLSDLFQTLHTPSRELMAKEEMQRIEEAFSELSDSQREVITLSRILGMSHREIAEQMGRTEVATRSLLLRALAALSAKLE